MTRWRRRPTGSPTTRSRRKLKDAVSLDQPASPSLQSRRSFPSVCAQTSTHASSQFFGACALEQRSENRTSRHRHHQIQEPASDRRPASDPEVSIVCDESQTRDQRPAVDGEVLRGVEARDLKDCAGGRSQSQPEWPGDVLRVDDDLAEERRLVLRRYDRGRDAVAEDLQSLFRRPPSEPVEESGIVAVSVESSGDDAANPRPPARVRRRAEMGNDFFD